MIHWDDIEILKLVDALQKEGGQPLSDARQLFERASGGQNLYSKEHRAAFGRELLLARSAGLVHFELAPQIGRQAPPRVEDYEFLDRLREIQLTPFGRDRAIGRIVHVPPPDPSEDDGRTIAALTLEEISRAIAEQYTNAQLEVFLVESGIDRNDLAGEVQPSWAFVQSTLLGLLEGGSARRRVLRRFLGAWLSDELHTGPRTVEQRDHLLTDLARQGWHLRNGRLVAGDRMIPQRHAPAPADTVFGAPSQGARPTDCFVLLPLSEPFVTIYRDLVLPAVEKLDMTCQNAAEIFGPGHIVSDVRYLIGEASIVVAELTGRNPNVFYELGIAHALGKPVVQLTQNIEDVPFDIRHLRTLPYEWREEWPPQELDRLRDQLSAHLAAATGDNQRLTD